jgi:hypothetical protein
MTGMARDLDGWRRHFLSFPDPHPLQRPGRSAHPRGCGDCSPVVNGCQHPFAAGGHKTALSSWRRREGGTLTKAVAGILTALVLAGCGGSDESESGFEDRAVFEAFVAGYLRVESVSCTSTTELTARCTDNASDTVYLVACETADGENCTIRER